MDSQWHGKCPCLIVFCLVHLTHMKTGERALKASQATTFNGWGGRLKKGSCAKRCRDEGRTLHSGDESTGSKGLTDPKPPAAQAKSALKMSPVSNWALSLNCAHAYQPSWPHPRLSQSTNTPPLCYQSCARKEWNNVNLTVCHCWSQAPVPSTEKRNL